MTSGLGRRLVALIAAYTLALNALLSPVVMTAMAAAPAWTEICTSGEGAATPAGEKSPAGHHAACALGACSAAGCGALAAPSARAPVPFAPGPGRWIDSAHWTEGAGAVRPFGPQLARAPPLA